MIYDAKSRSYLQYAETQEKIYRLAFFGKMHIMCLSGMGNSCSDRE
jgi:hypothetical protein